LKSWYGSILSRGVSRRLSSPNSSSESLSSRFWNFCAWQVLGPVRNSIYQTTYLFIQELKIRTALIFDIRLFFYLYLFSPSSVIPSPFIIFIIVLIGWTLEWEVILKSFFTAWSGLARSETKENDTYFSWLLEESETNEQFPGDISKRIYDQVALISYLQQSWPALLNTDRNLVRVQREQRDNSGDW